ncbi:MAG TPA: cation:proton antiporter [Miltoncostaeaceae bacterium]|nr:cation:proton antiporter [Miltoncostaeaceae bacterium]
MEWFLIAGVLLVGVALAGSAVDRLPMSVPVLYLGVGVLLGPWVTGLLSFDPFAEAELLEVLTEIAVVVSLFGAGLAIRVPLRRDLWMVPLRLAFGSMAITVGLIAVTAVLLLDVSVGVAILLGAVLAPTDPVLAAEVRLRGPFDRDVLRRGLTTEAGLNDGTAFPFVMLGLGIIGLHELGPNGLRWVGVDLIWAIVAGLAVGAIIAVLVTRLVLYARRFHRAATGFDDFIALGIVALAYGAALAVHSYGFLAAFAAGVAVRQIERWELGDEPSEEARDPAAGAETHPRHAPAYMARALLEHNEQLERIGELALVVLVGAMLAHSELDPMSLVVALLLVFVLRPVSVALGLLRSPVHPYDKRLFAWLGVRGIGSLYYLSFAVTHGLGEGDARTIIDVALISIALSVVVHGVSVTPLLERRRTVVDREVRHGDRLPEPGRGFRLPGIARGRMALAALRRSTP